LNARTIGGRRIERPQALRIRRLEEIDGIDGIDEKGADSMEVKIKVMVNFSVSDSSMEDALAEYDELTVEGLIEQIVDKAIACDEITVKVVEGPNSLEELDKLHG
jgi:hypothetical protein